jgi:hypothetical protein
MQDIIGIIDAFGLKLYIPALILLFGHAANDRYNGIGTLTGFGDQVNYPAIQGVELRYRAVDHGIIHTDAVYLPS